MNFTVRIDFSYGRCTLVMGRSGEAVTVGAYHLHRPFEELVNAVCQLADGAPTTCCRRVAGK